MPIALKSTGGGSVTMDVPSTASTFTLTLPAVTGTVLQTGTAVTVAQGGTGLATLTANNVLLGNGTGTPQFVAPGTTGNVLTSNGTTWASTAPTTYSSTTLGTPTASTSGTTITYTGIPSTAKRIVMMWSLVQTSGSSSKLMRLGTSGGIVNTGYSGSGSSSGLQTNSTTGFIIYSGSSSNVINGAIECELLDATNNIWVAFGVTGLSDAASIQSTGGRVALTGPLTQVQFTTVNGTDTFAAGSVNIIYQS